MRALLPIGLVVLVASCASGPTALTQAACDDAIETYYNRDFEESTASLLFCEQALRQELQDTARYNAFLVELIALRGNALAETYDFDSALVELERSYSLSVDSEVSSPLPSGFRGMLLSQMGRLEQGLGDQNLALRLATEIGDEQNIALQKTERAATFLQLEDVDRALSDLNDATAIYPVAAFRRADAYFQLGQFEEAREDYQTALPLLAANEANLMDFRHVALRSYIANARLGLEPDVAIFEDWEGLSNEDWPAPVASVLQDQMTASSLLESLGLESREWIRRNRLCDANFYVAEYYLSIGDEPAALAHFRQAVMTGAIRTPTYFFAKAELTRRGIEIPSAFSS